MSTGKEFLFPVTGVVYTLSGRALNMRVDVFVRVGVWAGAKHACGCVCVCVCVCVPGEGERTGDAASTLYLPFQSLLRRPLQGIHASNKNILQVRVSHPSANRWTTTTTTTTCLEGSASSTRLFENIPRCRRSGSARRGVRVRGGDACQSVLCLQAAMHVGGGLGGVVSHPGWATACIRR